MDEGVKASAPRDAYEARRGAIAILPLALGASVYGLAFGFLAVQVGFPWWGVAIMSASTHAGSSQIIAVEQFASTGVVLGAVLAGASLNLRYVGIIASLSEVLAGLSLRKKLLAIHITGDENWTCPAKLESSSEGRRSISWASRNAGSGRNSSGGRSSG